MNALPLVISIVVQAIAVGEGDAENELLSLMESPRKRKKTHRGPRDRRPHEKMASLQLDYFTANKLYTETEFATRYRYLVWCS